MKERKIEVSEGDLKKVILLLKLSEKYVRVPDNNLALCNLWRISGNLADRLMKKAELSMMVSKGRITLKPIEGAAFEVKVKNSIEEKPISRTPRCRKRKK